MSSCEKCRRDANRYSGDVIDEYRRLLEERHSSPCTPEERAGPGATECPRCDRKTIHQYTQEPMCGCKLLQL